MIDVEHALRDLAAHADVDEFDVSAAVRARLRDAPVTARRWRWRWAAAAAAVVAAVLGIVPGTRTAIADWFGLRGVEVRYENRPTPPTTASPGVLDLGDPVPLSAAAGRLGHPVLVAPAPPDAVYADGAVVTLRYGSILLSEFPGGSEEPFVLKKLLPHDASVRDVTVNGGHGLWIEGPHSARFGTFGVRRAESTLLWEQGALTLRLEGAGSLDAALALAGTLVPAAV